MLKEILYMVAGIVTGPFGGAVAGYLYANAENQLSELQGLSKTKSPSTSAIIGFLGGCVMGLGGAYYALNLSRAQDRIETFIRSHQLPPASPPSMIDNEVRKLEKTIEKINEPKTQPWQDKESARRDQSAQIQR
jgi:hypothetical protein